jgi:hypothetical protein
MRPILKAITLTYDLNGHTWHQDVDLERTVALFWNEDHMVNILGAFYKAKRRKLSVKQAIAGFGPNAASLFKREGKKTITKKLLRQLWNVPKPHPAAPHAQPSATPEGQQPIMAYALNAMIDVEPVCIGKDPSCPPMGIP